MSRHRSGCLLLAALLVGAPLTAWADNPRLGVRLEEVTCREAAAALARAAGVRVEVRAREHGEAKHRFDWTNATLAQALRELCARCGLRLDTQWPGGGYMLVADNAAGPPPQPVGVFEQDGARIAVQAVRVDENRQRHVDFQLGRLRANVTGRLALDLVCRLATVDSARVIGVENVAAMDDRGTVLAPDPFRNLLPGPGMPRTTLPDEWTGSVWLDRPAAQATRLEWVTGDLMIYGRAEPRVLRVALPPGPAGAAAELGGARLHVLALRPVAEEDEPGRGGGLRLEGTLTVPPDPARNRLGFLRAITVELVGASGRRYTPHGRSVRGTGNGEASQVTEYQVEFRYGKIEEPVVQAEYRFLEKGAPRKLVSFRLQGIPLPPPAARPERPPAVPPPLAAPPAPTHAHFNPRGGTLTTRVTLDGAPATEGTLAWGLARQDSAAGGGIRWIEVNLDGDGAARLEQLQPGLYRLRRVYRGGPDADPRPGGRWQYDDLAVKVTAGKETAVPPLAWVPAPDATERVPRAAPPGRRAPGGAGRPGP